LLKKAIPFRIYTPWDEEKPGFEEIDLVAHCGQSIEGQYAYTLTSTDIATGWTECLAIPQKTQVAVSHAVQELQRRLPFDLLGLDSDNGSEFINETLFRYCQAEKITFTVRVLIAKMFRHTLSKRIGLLCGVLLAMTVGNTRRIGIIEFDLR
jgi:hypothetical protein